MAKVLVIGAGLTGCTLAYALAGKGIEVILIEKTGSIGGNVRGYGCKAVEKCQNCGVCLTAGLWKNVSTNPGIQIELNCVIKDIKGFAGNYDVSVSDLDDLRNEKTFKNIDSIVVCTGFDNKADQMVFHLHINNTTGVLSGTQLENILFERSLKGIFEKEPRSLAFIQCVGSRDKNEQGLYCSRVCCSYSTRAAKVIRSYYPECEIVFFYMELQNVEAENYYSSLTDLGMEFIKCRPLKVSGGVPVVVEYEDATGQIKSKEFDLVILSNGIYAGKDNDHLAELCGFDRDKDGFLQTVDKNSGFYVAGCARSPMKIDEAYSDAVTIAGEIVDRRKNLP